MLQAEAGWLAALYGAVKDGAIRQGAVVVNFHGVFQGRRCATFFTGLQHFVLQAAVGDGNAFTLGILGQKFFAGFQVIPGRFFHLLLLGFNHTALEVTNQLIQILVTQLGFAVFGKAITQACHHGIQIQVFQAAHLLRTAEAQCVGRFLVITFQFSRFLTTCCQQDSSRQHDSQFLHSASNWPTVVVAVPAPYHRAFLRQ